MVCRGVERASVQRPDSLLTLPPHPNAASQGGTSSLLGASTAVSHRGGPANPDTELSLREQQKELSIQVADTFPFAPREMGGGSLWGHFPRTPPPGCSENVKISTPSHQVALNEHLRVQHDFLWISTLN